MTITSALSLFYPDRRAGLSYLRGSNKVHETDSVDIAAKMIQTNSLIKRSVSISFAKYIITTKRNHYPQTPEFKPTHRMQQLPPPVTLNMHPQAASYSQD
jgi:hypothetical protein